MLPLGLASSSTDGAADATESDPALAVFLFSFFFLFFIWNHHPTHVDAKKGHGRGEGAVW